MATRKLTPKQFASDRKISIRTVRSMISSKEVRVEQRRKNCAVLIVVDEKENSAK